MDYVDSKNQKLNSGEIIPIFLSNTEQPHPMNVMMPAVLTELNQPNVKTKQFGNTLFEIILGDGDKAFFKAFNADIGPNFVENSKKFCVWASKVMRLKILVTEFKDPSLEQLFKIISMNPPMPDMGYQAFKMKSGNTRIVLNLGA